MQTAHRAIADGMGGVIAAWTDSRNATKDIFATRLDKTGKPPTGWRTFGKVACDAAGDQVNPALTSDGAGGTLITWEDGRNGAGHLLDIYAVRLNFRGDNFTGWIADGEPVCTATGAQTSPVIESDGAGGAIIAWEDARSGVTDIYAIRLNSNGDLVPGWPANGRRLCSSNATRSAPAIVADGAGGAIVIFNTFAGNNHDVYAQRVTATGAIPMGWPPDGQALCAWLGTQYGIRAVSDGAGGAIVTWYDTRSGNHDIYAQRVTGNGVVPAGWPATGLPISTVVPTDQTAPEIASDAAGGAIVVWTNEKFDGTRDVVAQRITASGAIAPGWSSFGRIITSDPADQYSISVAANGAGGAIVVWTDVLSGDSDIYHAEITSSGVLESCQSTNGAPACTVVYSQDRPLLVSDAQGGAIVVWEDGRAGSGDSDLYAQRLMDPEAALLTWPQQGCGANVMAGISGEVHLGGSVSDGSGGVIVTWVTGPLGPGNTYNGRIVASRIDAAGDISPGWPAAGVTVRDSLPLSHFWHRLQVSPDGGGGAFVAWDDDRGGDSQPYVQRITSSGTIAPGWPANGMLVPNLTGASKIVPDHVGGVYIAGWNDVVRVTGQGGVTELDLPPLYTINGLSPDGMGGVICIFDRTADGILALRFTDSGAIAPEWPASGLTIFTDVWPSARVDCVETPGTPHGAICIAAIRQYSTFVTTLRVWRINADATVGNVWSTSQAATPRPMVEDGHGGALFVVQDGGDLVVRRITSHGVEDWLTALPNPSYSPPVDMVSDGKGGALFTHVDGNTVVLQRICANGDIATGWPTQGVEFCTSAMHKPPMLVSDQAGGALVTMEAGGLSIRTARAQATAAFPLGYTPEYVSGLLPGTNVDVDLGPLSATFDSVTSAGTIELLLLSSGPEAPSGFQVVPVSAPTYYDLSTSAGFVDSIQVCVPYDPATVTGAEAELSLLHYDQATTSWTNITASVDTVANVVCGATASLSPFILAEGAPTDAGDPDPMPRVPRLYAAAPNPFNPLTTIRYDLPRQAHVRLEIYDLRGRLVRTLVDAVVEAGRRQVSWRGEDGDGRRVASGVYFYRLQAGEYEATRRMVLLK